MGTLKSSPSPLVVGSWVQVLTKRLRKSVVGCRTDNRVLARSSVTQVLRQLKIEAGAVFARASAPQYGENCSTNGRLRLMNAFPNIAAGGCLLLVVLVGCVPAP